MVKKICFYSFLSSGHMNVCVTWAKNLLENHDVEIYFIVDEEWEGKLAKLDDRFKFAVIGYDSSEQQKRMLDLLSKIEALLKLPLLERCIRLWTTVLEDKTAAEIDLKAEEKIREIAPDVLLCDQIFHTPTMYSLNVPVFFIVSANPLVFGFDGFPKMGLDTGVDDAEEIERIANQMEDLRVKKVKILTENFKERGVQPPEGVALECPLNPKTAAVYTYPLEVDYYTDAMRREYRLWQLDSPISEERTPGPFEMPEEFKKLPGKTIYLSLGSLFSAYVDKLQRLVDILDKISNVKFIVSKGINGDKLKFPSNRFIGENFVDQLAVLQVVDLAILHGGNNSFSEAFHFGVTQIIVPVLADQINNAKRLEETGFGYRLDLMSYTEDELIGTVKKALNNEKLQAAVRLAGQRIRLENRSKLDSISSKLIDYLEAQRN